MTDELAEFRLGKASAFDRENGADAEVGETVTTLNSWWNHLLCETCGHSFRRGDRVFRDSRDFTVRHLDPRLGCAGEAGAPEAEPAEPPADLAEFTAGVDEAWPQNPDVPAVRLAAGDWRVRRPPRPLARSRCLFCAHTFRAGEQVVVCPCGPRAAACGAAVHRDPAAALVCWESWRPAGTVTTCPVTSSAERLAGGRP